MNHLSLTRVIVRRIVDDWKLLSTVFVGIVIATVIGAATPIYLESLEQLSFNAALDRIKNPKIDVIGAEIVASEKSIEAAERVIRDAIDKHIAEVYDGHEQFIKSNVAIVGTPDIPLPEGGGRGVLVSRGYVQHLSNLSDYVRFTDGEMATSGISDTEFGPKIEAVVTSKMAKQYSLNIEDEVLISAELISQRAVAVRQEEADADDLLTQAIAQPPPVPAGPPSVAVVIVGIFEPLDPQDRVWGRSKQALEPPVIETPTPLLTQPKPGETPLVMFADENAMRVALGDLIEETTFLGQETYVKGAPLLVHTPAVELPISTGVGIITRLGYLTSLTNIKDNVVIDRGRLHENVVTEGPRGPVIEAIVHRGLSLRIQAELGDVLEFSPELGQDRIVSAEIVGFIEEDDKNSDYWKSASLILSLLPQSQESPFLILADEGLSTVPMVVDPEVLGQVLADTYPGGIVKPKWFVRIDAENLKKWSAAEARDRFSAFSDAITEAMPDARPNTEFVENLSQSGELRNFFAKIPMLLLLTVILLTVLFFLGILVSYLTQSRENDSSLLKTLGATLAQLTRIYTTEGLVMVVVAVILGPFVAYGMVAVSGILPFFDEMNSGNLMPVRISAVPFVISVAVGLLCLSIFVIPNVLSAQGGVLLRRLQTSRPSDLPFLQRYNIDVAILVLGGLTFWELQKRGQFVSSGLFEQTKVNEVLLVAPVLFLIVVTLVFMRFFPMIVRYVSGESVQIVHLLTVTSGSAATIGVYWRERGNETTDWLIPVVVALLVGVAYWLTRRQWDNRQRRLIGFAVQTALVIGFVALRPLASGDLLGIPTLGLIAIVPAQILFMVFVGINRVTPVWLEMGLFHMSRNPMQYTWLILLLVLATGLGILATTVGGTLERSQEDRILFEEGADLRVTASVLARGGVLEVQSKSMQLDGVVDVAIGYRHKAQTGGSTVQVLGVDTDRFADIAWYRNDFSDSSLAEVMEKIKPDQPTGRIQVPDEANGIGMWVKPVPFIPDMDLYVQLANEKGVLQTIFLQRPRTDDWQFMIGNIPDTISPPFSLAAFQIFEPGADPQAGLTGVPVSSGTLYIDDIIATVGFENEEVVLDDFEGEELRWEPILTTAVSTESVSLTTSGARNGSKAINFSFGGQTAEGLRGFYPTAAPGPLPVAISSSLVRPGREIGDTFTTKVDRRWLSMKVVEVVDFFPTHNPDQGGVVVTDLNSLVERANVLQEFQRIRPLELFYDLKPGSHEWVSEAMVDILGPQGGAVRDGQGKLERLQVNPFVAAGWRPMTILSPLIGVLAAAVGYVTYLLLFAKRSGAEIGSLRTLGLSRGQLLSLLGFEHLAIAAVGIGLGTWAGFQMSRLTVSPLAITEIGDPVVPPFILTTDWPIMGTMYVALGVLFVAALVALNRGIGQLDLRAISRFGE